jgi:hypothetical protein
MMSGPWPNADSRAIPVEGHIAHGLGAVLDAPVPAIEFKDALRAGLLGRQADDGKDDFAALCARLQVGDGGLDAADLGDVGKAQLKVSVASRNRSWRAKFLSQGDAANRIVDGGLLR